MGRRRTRLAVRFTGTWARARPRSRRRSSACSDLTPLVEAAVALRSAACHGRRASPGGLKTMRRIILAALLAASASVAIAAPTPKEQLLVPPANADRFVVVSEAGKHGDEWRWTQADGSTAYRESILLRGLVFEQDEVVQFDKSGTPISVTV